MIFLTSVIISLGAVRFKVVAMPKEFLYFCLALAFIGPCAVDLLSYSYVRRHALPFIRPVPVSAGRSHLHAHRSDAVAC